MLVLKFIRVLLYVIHYSNISCDPFSMRLANRSNSPPPSLEMLPSQGGQVYADSSLAVGDSLGRVATLMIVRSSASRLDRTVIQYLLP